MNEYSDSEREAEYAALESQRRQLRACLRTEAGTPPPLERKHPIPLPLTTPPLLSFIAPPGDEASQIKYEAVADSGLSTVDGTRSTSKARVNKAAVRQQLPTEHTRQRSPLLFRPSHPSRRPSLHVVIPGSEHREPWLSRPICSSPLVCFSDMPPLLRSPLTPRSVRDWYRCTFAICSSQCTCRPGIS
jgi:hypothetical protein